MGLIFGAGTAKGKAITKAVAKGYMAVSEKTTDVMSRMREDMRDAVEEARYEREQEETAYHADDPDHDAEAVALQEEAASGEAAHRVAGPMSPAVAAPIAAEPAAVSTATGKVKSSPKVIKSLARGYMTVSEKTRDAMSGLRENMRDAIEEARYERERAAQRAAQTDANSSDEVESATAATATATIQKEATPAEASAKTAKPRARRAAPAGTKSVTIKSATVSRPSGKKPAKESTSEAHSAPKSGHGPEHSSAETLLEVAEIAAEAL